MKTDRRRVHVFRRGVLHLVREDLGRRDVLTWCGLRADAETWCWCKFHWPSTPMCGARDCFKCVKAVAA